MSNDADSKDVSDRFMGIDVSKARLDVAVLPTEAVQSFSNDEVGCGELVAWATGLRPQLIVLEATGGLEMLITGLLTAAGLPVAVMNPRQIRDFAKACGTLAKTDAVDAKEHRAVWSSAETDATAPERRTNPGVNRADRAPAPDCGHAHRREEPLGDGPPARP